MKRFFIILLGLFLVLLTNNCTSEEGPLPPDDLLSESKMIDVLAEICKVEARFQRRLSIRHTTNSELVLHNYNIVFEEQNVSLEAFKNSYQYYEESAETMQHMYDSVIVRLTQQEVDYKNSIQEPEKK